MEAAPRTSTGRCAIAALFAATTAGTVAFSYWSVFSAFSFWDDEGPWLVGVRAFLNGHALYSDVFSFHGPFNFLAYAVLYGFDPAAVTNDGVRFIAIGISVLSALAVGLSVTYACRSWLLGIAAQMVWAVCVETVKNEPGHPVGLISLLLAGAACTLLTCFPARPRLGLGILGALTGALVMTKVNVGLLMLAGLALALTIVSPRLRSFRVPATVVGVAVPFALMARNLGAGQVRNFAVATGMAITAAALASRRPSSRPHIEGSDHLLTFVVALLAVIAFTVAVPVLLGSSLGDVMDGAFLIAVGQPEVYTKFLDVGVSSIILAALALAVAGALSTRTLDRELGAWVRLAAGALIWIAVLRTFELPDGESLVLTSILTWVVMLPREREQPWEYVGRNCLAFAAVFQALHAYPVGGSQVGPAKMLFVIVGALAMHDGIRELADAHPTRRRLSWALPVAAAAIAVSGFVNPVVRANNNYSGGVGLPFDGAKRIRLPVDARRTYVDLVAAIKDDCDAFVTEPGFISLHIWSGVKPVTNRNFSVWMPIFSESDQREIVTALLKSRRPCAVYSKAGVEFWLGGDPPPDRALHRAIARMNTILVVGNYELRVRAARAAAFARQR